MVSKVSTYNSISSYLGIIILFYLLFIFTSCNQTKPVDSINYKIEKRSFSNAQALIQWTEEPQNGFIRERNLNELLFGLKLKPSSLLLANQIIENNELTTNNNPFDEILYFDFKITKNAKGNYDFLNLKPEQGLSYSERVIYCAFKMQKDFCIKQNGNSILPLVYHFERTFGVGNGGTILIGFEKSKLSLNQDFIVSYNDQLFGAGIINFYFDKSYLINSPVLKT